MSSRVQRPLARMERLSSSGRTGIEPIGIRHKGDFHLSLVVS